MAKTAKRNLKTIWGSNLDKEGDSDTPYQGMDYEGSHYIIDFSDCIDSKSKYQLKRPEAIFKLIKYDKRKKEAQVEEIRDKRIISNLMLELQELREEREIEKEIR